MRPNQSNQSRRSSRGRNGNDRRHSSSDNFRVSRKPDPKKPSALAGFFAKLVGFFKGKPTHSGNGTGRTSSKGSRNNSTGSTRPARPVRTPERVEVTTPRLYVGNLSYDATESDLFELFNGVGKVQNAEVVTNQYNQKSKGFAFVQMQSVEEAQRAVAELHDKEFLGRKLLVNGAKSTAATATTADQS